MSVRGVGRVLAKLEASLETGNYYEAHQMYRTLYFRYTGQRKFEDCLDLLFRGSTKLLDKEQFSSGADLALLVVDTLEKQGDNIDDFELWIHRLGILITKMGPNTVERETVIGRSIKWSSDISKINLGYPLMHKLIAQTLWSEGNAEQARHHYLLSRDGIGCGRMLVQISQTRGYPSETDMFIAQVVLQQLCLKETETALETFETYAKYHPKIATTEPPYPTPLLNFIYFLIKIIATARLATFKALCDLYRPSINRDPSYDKYLQKIGIIFFGAAPEQQPTGLVGGLFGDLINRLFQGFEDDEEEDESSSNDVTPQTETRRNNRLNNQNSNELD